MTTTHSSAHDTSTSTGTGATPHWTAPLPASHQSHSHSPQALSDGESGKKKKKIIKWDEVTIAEHDKERGTRMKVDEAPTPYRYLSESEASESGSDGEFLAKRHHCHGDKSDDEEWEQERERDRERDKFGERVLANEWGNIEAKLRDHSLSLALSSSSRAAATNNNNNNNNINAESTSEATSHNADNDADVKEVHKETQMRPRLFLAPVEKTEPIETEKESPLEIKQREKEKERVREKERLTESGYTDFGFGVSPRTHSKTHRTGFAAAERERDRERTRPALFAEKEKDLFAGIGRVLTPERTHQRGRDDAQGAECARGIAFTEEQHEEEQRPKESQSKDFLHKRNSHYNEFKMLQAMRAKMEEEDDEDDD